MSLKSQKWNIFQIIQTSDRANKASPYTQHHAATELNNTESNILFSYLVRRLQSKGILIQIFPLHEKEELKRLSFTWFKKVKLSLQPLGEWKKYQLSLIVFLVKTLWDKHA